jgi:hypothetical protein
VTYSKNRIPNCGRASFVLTLLLSCTPAFAGEIYRFDFEEGTLPADLNIADARITDASDLVLTGGFSLICDARKGRGTWNEFIHTDATSIPFEKGHLYRLAFDYRVLVPREDIRRTPGYYYLARSASHEAGGIFDQMYWLPDDASTGHEEREFPMVAADDYFLILGVQDRGAIVIDDLTIEDLGSMATREVRSIQTGFPCPYADLVEWLDDYDATYHVRRRMHDMVFPVGFGGKRGIDELIDRYVRELDFDYVDWTFIPSLAAKYGIRGGKQGMEYDAYCKEEGPQYWDDRFEYFRDRGFLEDLAGDIHSSEFWCTGGYWTCHVGDRWHRAQLDSMLDYLDQYHDICQDNLTWANFYRRGCYCDSCLQRFREHLAERYSAEELTAWGIHNLPAFDMRDYLKAKPSFGFGLLEDPIVREWIKFQNLWHYFRWAEKVVALKKKGLDMGRSVCVYGNQTAMEILPTAACITQFDDVVQLEGSETELYYLMGRGSGNSTRAVWTRGEWGIPFAGRHVLDWPQLTVDNVSRRMGLALAFGGFKRYYLWWDQSHCSGDSPDAYCPDESPVYEFTRRYAQYMNEHRALYGPRRMATEVGIVYSYPSHMWRSFSSLGIDAKAWVAEFHDWCNWMLDNHIQFDVVYFGHPEMWDDTEVLAELTRYKVLILPSTDCLTEHQAEALRRCADSGSHIYVTGSLGTRDEDYNNIDPPRSQGIATRPARRSPDMLSDLRQSSPVSVHADRYIRVAVWRSTEGNWWTVHFFTRQSYRTREEGIDVTLTVPPDMTIDSVLAVSFEHDAFPLEFDRDDDTLTFTLPQLYHYTMVVIGEKAEWEKAQEEAELRREADREMVKQEAELREE